MESCLYLIKISCSSGKNHRSEIRIILHIYHFRDKHQIIQGSILFKPDFKLPVTSRLILVTGITNIRWVLIIIFFEILIPPEPFMRDAPHFFYRKYNKNLL